MRIFLKSASVILLGLTGCVEPIYQQQYAAQTVPPTMTQIQGQCFNNFKQFIPQTDCITRAASSGLPLSSYAQEYLATLQSLQEKVKHKELSESDARLRLTKRLTEIRSIQQNELAIEQQLDNQRTMQTLEILKQNKPYIHQLPDISSGVSSPTHTTCQAYGNQMRCVSR